jgi:hypothetical protein
LSKPENIKRTVIAIRDVFAQIVDIVASIAGGIVSVLDFFGAISDQKAASIQGFLGGAGNNIRSLGGDMGGISVSDQTARRDITATSTATNVEDNMSMRRGSSKEVVNLNVTTYVSDTKRDATARYEKEGNFDLQTGK